MGAGTMSARPAALLAGLLLACGAVRAQNALKDAMYRAATFDLCVRLFTRDGSVGCSGAAQHGANYGRVQSLLGMGLPS